MLLEIAGMLTLAGFFTWILGAVFEYPGIATIGGAVIVVVGALVTGTGLEYRTGEVVTENTTFDGSVVENSTVYNSSQTTKEVSYVTESVAFPTRFPAGVLLMIVGGLLTARVWGEEGGIM